MSGLPARPASPPPSPRRGPRGGRLLDRIAPAPRGTDTYIPRDRRNDFPPRNRARGRRSPEPQFDRDRRPPPPHFDQRDRDFVPDRNRYRPDYDRRPLSPRGDRFSRRLSRSPRRRTPPPRRLPSPRPRSRSPKRIKRPQRSASPPRRRPPISPKRPSPPPRSSPVKDEPPEPGLIMEDSPPPPSPIKHEPEPEPVKLETPPPITPVIKPEMEEVLPTPPPPRPLPTQPRAAIAAAAATAEKPEVSIPTGPRQPRGRGAARGGMPTQAQGRSPPRGPRGDREQRFLPRGRGGRRGMPLQPGTFSNATQLGPVSKYPSAGPSTPATPTIEPLPVPEKKEPQIVLPPLPTIPPWELRFQAPERTDLIATLNNGRLHRAALKKQYADPDKNPRRAEIELELATIDWRATESRTMTMHMQVELARAGKFGIDYKAPEEVITVL